MFTQYSQCFLLQHFVTEINFFFQICESKFLGTLSSLAQFVLKQVKIQGHTELTCEAQFYHCLAV